MAKQHVMRVIAVAIIVECCQMIVMKLWQNAFLIRRLSMNTKDAQARIQLCLALEKKMLPLYGAYLYLRDHDLSEESNTSRLLQEHSKSYLLSRLSDELQEMADVQCGEHGHTDRQSDTILSGSQVGYGLMLLAAIKKIKYDDFIPHKAVLEGYYGQHDSGWSVEQQQNCLSLLANTEPAMIAQGLRLGFALIGWACAEANVNPLDPAEFDLAQMRRKGLIGQ